MILGYSIMAEYSVSLSEPLVARLVPVSGQVKLLLEPAINKLVRDVLRGFVALDN